jgi:vacuolar-type H+-ATPase subunit I/STV1
MADTPSGETVTPESLSNNGTVPATPVVNADTAEVERLKKEAAQAIMAGNQARNELERIKTEQEATKQKQLLEKEEFKTLYEQSQSRLDEITKAQEAQERQSEITAATNDVFKDYSPDTIELAKLAGLGLSDDSDSAKAVLKEKLDAFQAKVGNNAPTVLSNNPRQTTPETVDNASLVARDHVGGESIMAVEAAKGNINPQLEYISKLSAIKKMRQQAQE